MGTLFVFDCDIFMRTTPEQAQYEVDFMGEMNDRLSLAVDTYMFDRLDDYVRDHEAIVKFVAYVIESNNEDLDEPRGKDGWTYRRRASEGS